MDKVNDKKYTPPQHQINAKAKKLFAQSCLKLLSKTDNKRLMRNLSKNYPLNCLKKATRRTRLEFSRQKFQPEVG